MFCCFRESCSHQEGVDGSVRILASLEGEEWQSAAFLKIEGFDLRDPHFSITPTGELLMICGGSLCEGGKALLFHTFASFSKDGTHWSELENLPLPGEWLWRLTWHGGVGYGTTYRKDDTTTRLLQTKTGKEYTLIALLSASEPLTEVTLRFFPDDTMCAFARGEKRAWLGLSHPPYTAWSWKDIGGTLGGPNFLILPDGDMIGAARLQDLKSKDTITVLGELTYDAFIPSLWLPSGGDTSYAGMLLSGGTLYLSYYSSHEQKTCIYLAEIKLI